MKRKKLKKTCYIKNNYELVNKKWLFQTLCCFKDEQPHRFKELLEMMKGISTKTLSQRLKELVSENILEKIDYNETPPRTEYLLTEKGYELLLALEPFEEWSQKWMIKKTTQRKE